MTIKEDRAKQVFQLTADYLDAIVNVYKDDDKRLADAANDSLANIKQEAIFKGKATESLDSVSLIAIASILGY